MIKNAETIIGLILSLVFLGFLIEAVVSGRLFK
jgi:hypothetical protein